MFVDDNGEGVRATPSKLDSFRRRAVALERKIDARDAVAAFRCDEASLSPEEYEARRKGVLQLLRGTQEVTRELVESFKAAVEQTENCTYLEAPHQADGQLVQMFNDKRVDAVLSPDGDLLVHGLPFLVRQVDAQEKVAQIGSLLALPWAGQPSSTPTRQVFTPTDTPLFRYACACILGSDEFPGGVRDVGAGKLERQLAAQPEARRDPKLLLAWAAKLADWPSAEVNPLTLGVEAMMYERVSISASVRRERLGYLHGAPKELHLLNHHLRCQQTVFYGAAADLDRCSRGHDLLKQGYRFVQCDLCDQWFCEYCANLKFSDKVEESDLWHCVWCRLGLVAEMTADDEEQPQGNTRSATFNDHLQQLAVRSRDAVRAQLLDAESVRLAPRAVLVAHLRALQVTHSGAATDAQLRALVRATLAGGVATFPRLDAAGEHAAGEATCAWWAAEWSAPAELLSAARFFADLTTKPAIKYLVRLVRSLMLRANAARPTNVNLLLGKYTEESATLARPVGGAERLVGRGVRGSVSARQPSFGHHQVGVVGRDGQQLLYVRARAVPSMRQGMYSTELWLAEDRLLAARCTCYAGAVMCTHAFVVLVQLEYEVMRVGGWLVPCVNDAVGTHMSTAEVAKLWPALQHLGRADFGRLSEQELKERFKPGTEKRKPPPSPATLEGVVHQPAATIIWKSPETMAASSRGGTSSAAGGEEAPRRQLYNPLAGVEFDVSSVDYSAVWQAFQAAPYADDLDRGTALSDTVGYHLVGLRALHEHEATVARARAEVEAVPRRSRRGVSRQREEEEEEERAISSSYPPPRQRCRPYFSCSFPGCVHSCGPGSAGSCGDRRWGACPRVSTSKNEARRLEQQGRRTAFLRKLNLPVTRTGVPRVCSCHYKDGDVRPENLMAVGVVAGTAPTTPSRGLAADRRRRWVAEELPAQALVDKLLEQLEEKDVELSEKNQRIARLENQVCDLKTARLQERRAPLRFHQLKGPDGRGELRYRTGFSCSEHMEAFLALLCNGNLDILSQLSDPGASVGSNPRGRRRALAPVDEALLYFEVERRGTSFARLSGEFSVSVGTVSRVVGRCSSPRCPGPVSFLTRLWLV
jgi:XPG I-region